MEQATLRLCAVAALLNGGAGTLRPTVAGDFIFDSKMDDIIDVSPTIRQPIAIVRTDEDSSVFNKNTFVGRQCRLNIEISAVTSVQMADGKSKIDFPKTDAQLELMLNVFEWQVWNALRGYDKWAQWFLNDMNFGALLGYSSTPRFTAPNRGAVRLAVRTLEFVMRMTEECLVPPLSEMDPIAPPFLPPRIVRAINYITAHGGGDFKNAVQGFGRILTRYAQVQQPRFPALRRVWSDFPDLETETHWPIEQVSDEPIVPAP